MESILHSLSGLGNFFGYFFLALFFLLLFTFAYARFTPHDEWKLVKEEKNTAAAIALGGALVGYSLALSSAASSSVSLVDFAVWAGVALITQCLAFLIIRLVFLPKVVERIEKAECPAGIIVAAVSVSVGLLNAACMSY